MRILLLQKREAVFDRDKHGFSGAQAEKASNQCKGQPQSCVQPKGGLELNLDKGGEKRYRKPDHHQRHEGRPIRRVMVFERESTGAAGIDNAKHILKQLALTAFRAARAEELGEEGAHDDDS
jgi:hypothetical protein